MVPDIEFASAILIQPGIRLPDTLIALGLHPGDLGDTFPSHPHRRRPRRHAKSRGVRRPVANWSRCLDRNPTICTPVVAVDSPTRVRTGETTVIDRTDDLVIEQARRWAEQERRRKIRRRRRA